MTCKIVSHPCRGWHIIYMYCYKYTYNPHAKTTHYFLKPSCKVVFQNFWHSMKTKKKENKRMTHALCVFLHHHHVSSLFQTFETVLLCLLIAVIVLDVFISIWLSKLVFLLCWKFYGFPHSNVWKGKFTWSNNNNNKYKYNKVYFLFMDVNNFASFISDYCCCYSFEGCQSFWNHPFMCNVKWITFFSASFIFCNASATQ